MSLHQSFDDAQGIVLIVDGERRGALGELRRHAEHAGADRVKGADPHAADRAAEQALDAVTHLTGRLVGKGDGEDGVRADAMDFDEPRDAGSEDAGLSRTGARKHENRAFRVQHRFTLRGIQPRRELLFVRCGRSFHHRSITSNVAPPDSSDGASIKRPLWLSSTMRRASESPMPHPLCFVEKPGSKIRARVADGTPGPSSATRMRTPPPGNPAVDM
jgi:hypothetical protein